MAGRWAELATMPGIAGEQAETSIGALLALAFPDRVAKNRGSTDGRFLLANGRGAQIEITSPLAREPYLAVAELAGSAERARILLAAPIREAEIDRMFGERIDEREEITFDAVNARLRGRKVRRLGALMLSEQPLAAAASPDAPTLLATGIARVGLDRLPWTQALRQWRDRVVFLRAAEGDAWPDLSDAALADKVEDWLAPMLSGKTALADVNAEELTQALHLLLPWNLRARLEQDAPTHFDAPSGSRVPIEYGPEGATLSIRVQELFGLGEHPSVAGGRAPLTIELLSPAQRPVQVTRDLPGFWRGSYAAVRSEMRGRYPKYPWPEDPLQAQATRRAKPRGT
ncbi:MAG: ATP-dependent helicase HrpB [Variibacter sp.]|nr:ATP-dependent helicase HrpB [Variibacter sp.]